MARDYQQLWEDVTSKVDEAEAVQALAEIVTDKEGRSFILLLERNDAELCIGILDHGTRECNLNPAEKNAFLVTLRRLAERHELLPYRVRMTEEIVVSDEIHAFGGFGDIRSQMYQGRRVAVKTARLPVLGELQMMRRLTDAQRKKRQEEVQKVQKIRKRFYREVILWSVLSHPNILKLLGVQEDMERGQLVTVAEWMERGTIMEYIESHHANRLELLHGAAQGLKYLHDANLAHGDLKGENILMSNETPPRACLANFGFITKVLDPGHQVACSVQLEGGTMSFMAPELLVPRVYGIEGAKPTPQADIYAFGLVIFQVLTGETPFCGIPQLAMGFHVLRGDRPTKPGDASAIGFSDSLWNFTEGCWSGKIESRPRVGEVVTHLGGAAAVWDWLMPPQVGEIPSCPEESDEPPVKRLDGEVTIMGDFPFAVGTYCEVWLGLWDRGGREGVCREKVALKVLRAPKSSERARKRLERELPSWEELYHQNILPFYGIVTDVGPHRYMVSPWEENGNLLDYVKQNPGVDKNYLLCGSAAGLSYLHAHGVVHGSVKCKNVLISQEGESRICDFGIATIVEEDTEGTRSTEWFGEAVRYSAPELIENNVTHATMSSDTYSFAMLIIECITERIPFSNLSRTAAVIHARIGKGQCPPRPDGRYPEDCVSDDLWGLMQYCWSRTPEDRPTTEQVHSFFLHYV